MPSLLLRKPHNLRNDRLVTSGQETNAGALETGGGTLVGANTLASAVCRFRQRNTFTIRTICSYRRFGEATEAAFPTLIALSEMPELFSSIVRRRSRRPAQRQYIRAS